VKVSELGEIGLINLIAKIIGSSRSEQPAWQNLVIGIGDDTAAWRPGKNLQLATTDSLLQDVHFTMEYTAWADLGWKAMAVNLSDIAAMGGVPRYALVAAALPVFTEVDDVTKMYHGMLELTRKHGVAIIGGDTDSAPMIIINVSLIGEASGAQVLTRSAASPGDKIAVTGQLGTAAAGYRMLSEKLNFNPEITKKLKAAFFRPQPRLPEGQLMVKEGVKTAIDISDGLITDLNHICHASKVSARINAAAVPVASEVKTAFGSQALELAMSGGEDYELLFTAPAEIVEQVRMKAAVPVTVIGEITSGMPGVTVLDEKGGPMYFGRGGWEHFRA